MRYAYINEKFGACLGKHLMLIIRKLKNTWINLP